MAFKWTADSCHLLGVSGTWLRSRIINRLSSRCLDPSLSSRIRIREQKYPDPRYGVIPRPQVRGLGISIFIGSTWTPLWSTNPYLTTTGFSWNLLFSRSELGECYILQPKSETRFWIPIIGISFVFQKLIMSCLWKAWIREWYGEAAEEFRVAKGGKFTGKKEVSDPRGKMPNSHVKWWNRWGNRVQCN